MNPPDIYLLFLFKTEWSALTDCLKHNLSAFLNSLQNLECMFPLRRHPNRKRFVNFTIGKSVKRVNGFDVAEDWDFLDPTVRKLDVRAVPSFHPA